MSCAIRRRSLLETGLALVWSLLLASVSHAQTIADRLCPSGPTYRPGTTTVQGDTGIWFLPTAEVALPRCDAISANRIDWDFQPGSSDVAHVDATFARTIRNGLELFGSWFVVTRIDRDVRPLFSDRETGGVVNEFPLVTNQWSQARGDLVVGAKLNIYSQADGHPVAFAMRPIVKLPIGDARAGVSTGRSDFGFDAVISREAGRELEWTLTAGFVARGNPPGVELVDGLRWGAGIALPTRRPLRLEVEAYGEDYLTKVVRVRRGQLRPPLSSVDVPPSNAQISPLNVNVGFDWYLRHRIFLGAAVNVNANQPATGVRSKVGFQGRLGFHPGVLMPK